MPIKVVVFDFWNTLIMGSDKKYLDKIVDKLNFQDIKDFWRFCDSHLFPTKMSMREFFNYLCKLKKIDNSIVDELMEYWTLASKTNKPFPDVVPVLNEFKGKYNLIILSNTSLNEANKVLDEFNLRQYFYDIILSPEFGIAKPNLEFFQKVLDLTNVPPEEVCLVGDDIENDIIPARRVGFQTVLLDRENKYNNPQEPDFVIKSLRELKDILM